ncbi:PAS domain S-box protein, partial [Crocinitomicaceae bacterium]|nr:PAS domain S-box protein [Crocinitomicaceae bacterium]
MIKGEKLKRLIEIGCIPSDSPEERLRKKIMSIMVIPYSLAGIIWGLYFMRNGNVISGSIPLFYGIFSLLSFFYFIYTKRFKIFRFSQVLLCLVLPFLLQLSLGGFSQSSGMIIWSCNAPFIALLFYNSSGAIKWFFALIVLFILACFLDESVREYFPKENDANSIVALFGANFIVVATLIFSIQLYFFNGKNQIKIELGEKEILLEAATEIEKQKELLIASKKKLELVMGSLDEVVWGRNLPDYQMQYVSNSVVQLYGFPMADWYENPNLWSDMIHPDDLAQVEMEGESLFTKGITEIEYRIITADKEIKWIHSTTRILKSTDGKPDFMTGIAKDITKLKEAEFKLVASEKSYRELFEKSANAALILKNNLFIECNDAAITMLGYKNKTALFNVPPYELSPEKQPDGQLSSEKSKEMNEIAYNTGTNRFEWYHVKSNGEVFPVEVLLTSLHSENSNDKTLHVVWRDMTEEKKAQNQLNELNDNLEIKVKNRTLELEESLEREKELGK